ncbi:hypothetical protein ACFLKB_09815 [Clostridium sp. FAM 1755]|uniref:PQ loop repeat family protein n=1 Tax=Clostridium botulinum TaxID=1491 RepID=A0A6M0T331_CLOBO|nr:MULTISPECIES: hypothetical protein [Clostridium]NFA62226.1 hypothetical protein [Clostridium botulinum]KOR23792.1 hypothetical protein ND00_30690 [Clostridium sp. L74]NFI72335.1 hypothetical protein [Clostridium sporogenes]NFL72918.1 hypothetical protein [Clostridium sporogenes]NFM25488.1 hypothetical protein [Clostridium sporogenes]
MSGLIKFGTIINIIGGILLLYSFLPQIYIILKTKSPGNNSIQYWIIMTFGISCICINQFICEVPRVQLIIQSINVVFAILTTILIIYFGLKESNNKKYNRFDDRRC